MSAIFVCGDLSGVTAYEDKPQRRGQTERERGQARAAALSVERGRGAAHSRFHRGAWRGFGFQRDHHGSASPVWRAVRANRPTLIDKTVRHQFVPAFKASGSLTFRDARFQSLQKSLRCIAQAFQGDRSFQNAHASQVQFVTRGTHEVGAMGQERGFLTQGEARA